MFLWQVRLVSLASHEANSFCQTVYADSDLSLPRSVVHAPDAVCFQGSQLLQEGQRALWQQGSRCHHGPRSNQDEGLLQKVRMHYQ